MNKAKRITYSKEFKTRVLIAFSRNQNLENIFIENGVNLKEFYKNDKKYLLKLVNKWRHEFYLTKENLFFKNRKLSDSVLEDELNALGNEGNEDLFEKHYLNNENCFNVEKT